MDGATIIAGDMHTVGLKPDGTVIAVGCNDYGQLDVSGWTGIKSPLSYPSTGTISDLKIDAGNGIAAKWSNINWSSLALPANTTIKFNVRTSNDNSTWSSWSPDYIQSSTGTTSESGTLTATASRYLEAKMTLASTDGVSTPTLNDFTVNYQKIDEAANVKQYRYDSNEDGSTEIADAGWGNELTSILKADMTGIDVGDTLTPEIELRDDTSFTGTAGTTDVAGATATYTGGVYTGSAVTGKAKVTGLPNGTYYWKVRAKDGSNRYGPWSSSYKTLKIEQTAPTGTVAVNTTTPGYVNNANVTLNTSGSDADSGMAGGKMIFSNDGVNFGNLNDLDAGGNLSTDYSSDSSHWADYATSYSWKLLWATSSDDGSKTVYVKYKDNAGNTSSTATSSITLDTAAPTVSVTTPIIGKSVKGGSLTDIAYTASDNGPAGLRTTTNPIDLYYTVGGGAQQSIASAQAYTGTYNWNPVASLNSIDTNVVVKATDKAGNTGSGSSPDFKIDSTGPTSSVNINRYISSRNYTSSTITGTASDNISLNKTEITIRRNSDSKYFDGDSWETGSALLDVGSSSPWNYNIGTSNLGGGVTYTVTSTATDTATNEQITLGSDIFTYDNFNPLTYSRRLSVTKGSTAKLYWRTSDAFTGNKATVWIKITSKGGTKQIGGTLKVNSGRLTDISKAYYKYYACRLNRGTYRYYVYARDQAGNTVAHPAYSYFYVR